MKSFFELTKVGISLFVLLSALAGFCVSFPIGETLEFWQPIMLLVGIYLVSSGSFAINQAQEWKVDRFMPRTQKRPVVSGVYSPTQAYLLGTVMIVAGLFVLALLHTSTALLALLTVVLYNGFYTLFWKKKWAFGAVPGAIPGAMPVVIGYSIHRGNIFSPECFYLFTIMFLWQMPHFWCLAIRFQEDYEKGGIPVLPLQIGEAQTSYHMGLYTIVYTGLALAAPLFIKAHFLHLFLVVPVAIKIILEFMKFYHGDKKKQWLPFFLWINLSVIVFLMVPAIEKWIFYYWI